MKRLFMLFLVAIVMLPYLTGSNVLADSIQWSESVSLLGPNLGTTTPPSASIYSLVPGAGAIGLSPGNATSGTNAGSIVSLGVTYSENPQGSAPPSFEGPSANYSLSLTLHDAASGASGSLIFHGNLSGWSSAGGFEFKNTFLDPTQTLTLGKNTYTVTFPNPIVMYPMGDASPMGDGVVGNINASISVQPTTASTPEPSSLLLACLSLPPLGLARCFRRQRRRNDVDDNANKA